MTQGIDRELSRKIIEITPGAVADLKLINPGYDNTNLVLEVVTHTGSYILKLMDPKDNFISPFWQGMVLLFNSAPGNGDLVAKMADVLNNINIFPVPKVLKYGKLAGEQRTYILVEKMKGESIEQGLLNEKQFMMSSDVAYALGQFLGKLKGIQTTKINPVDFRKNLAQCIEKMARSTPAVDNEEVQENLQPILTKISKMPLENFGFIMPDLWPSQFLMQDNQISALIDIESYVVGPIELELVVLELWLEDFASFRKGYESTGAKMPDLSATREIYRYLLYLMHGCPKLGLQNLLTSKMKL